jgi:hypothetical protein
VILSSYDEQELVWRSLSDGEVYLQWKVCCDCNNGRNKEDQQVFEESYARASPQPQLHAEQR